MKLKNKKTGEIGWLYEHSLVQDIIIVYDVKGIVGKYTSLAELNEEWEDYEEPKGIQCIYYVNHFDAAKLDGVIVGFETKEEAELAVRKLKAWKRLKDKGFRFEGWDNTDRSTIHNFSLFVAIEDLEGVNKDLDLLFGGEE